MVHRRLKWSLFLLLVVVVTILVNIAGAGMT